MKKLLLSVAIIGAVAGPAAGPIAAQEVEVFRAASDPGELRASDLMGMRIYASEAAVEGEEIEGLQEGMEDIGEVGDVVLSRDGMVQAVLVDIGGFLGIGERQVAVNMSSLRFVGDSATADNADDYFLVLNANREALEAAPEYVTGEGTAEAAAAETEEAVDGAAAATAAAAAGTVAAVEGAATETVTETGEALDDAATGEALDTDAATGEAAVVQETEATGDQAAGAEVAEDLAQADTAEETTEVVTAETTEPAAEATTTETEVVTAETTEATTETEMEADETAAAATDATGTDEVATTDEAAATTGRTPITREGFLAAAPEALTADRLQGAAVYDSNDERVGEVSELVLSTDGQITDAVVDVGGFLGIGEKPVAMAMDQIDILQQEGGEELRVYVSGTREELEAMPTYEE